MPFVRLTLAVAVSGGLYAAGLWLAPVAAPALLLVPLPGLMVTSRGRFVEGGFWLCLTAGAIAAGLGPDASPGYVFVLGIPTLVVAAALRQCWSLERTVVVGVGTWCLGVVSLSWLAYGDIPALAAAAREQLTNGIALTGSTGPAGAPATLLAAGDTEREMLIEAVFQLLPALVMLTGGLTVIGNLVLLHGWTGALQGVNLRRWRTPETLIWGLILAGFAMFVPVHWLALAARNAFVVLLACYFCQGVAIVDYYLDRFHLPRGIRVISYVLVAAQPLVTAMVLALGVFDLWGNFRRLGAGPADVRFHTDGQ
jgi:hypothetical protein